MQKVQELRPRLYHSLVTEKNVGSNPAFQYAYLSLKRVARKGLDCALWHFGGGRKDLPLDIKAPRVCPPPLPGSVSLNHLVPPSPGAGALDGLWRDRVPGQPPAGAKSARACPE